MDENDFFFSEDIIKLNKSNDFAFSSIAQGAKITGAILHLDIKFQIMVLG